MKIPPFYFKAESPLRLEEGKGKGMGGLNCIAMKALSLPPPSLFLSLCFRHKRVMM